MTDKVVTTPGGIDVRGGYAGLRPHARINRSVTLIFGPVSGETQLLNSARSFLRASASVTEVR